jgi:hypothetical protein
VVGLLAINIVAADHIAARGTILGLLVGLVYRIRAARDYPVE